jgi:hypothetical protein
VFSAAYFPTAPQTTQATMCRFTEAFREPDPNVAPSIARQIDLLKPSPSTGLPVRNTFRLTCSFLEVLHARPGGF